MTLYFQLKFKVDTTSAPQYEDIYILSPCAGPTATGWPAYNSTIFTLYLEAMTKQSNYGILQFVNKSNNFHEILLNKYVRTKRNDLSKNHTTFGVTTENQKIAVWSG